MAHYFLILFTTIIALSSSNPLKKDTKMNKYVERNNKFPFMDRTGWGARSPTTVTTLTTPVEYVVIHHTYQPGVCLTQAKCISAMRSMQNSHQLVNGWADIGYNFAIGGEGTVYEGRGWEVVGAHAVGYNVKSIGIALIGDWVSNLPSQKQLNAAKLLIEAGVSLGYIRPDYKLIGHRQASATECPGQALFNEISTWDHFRL